MTRTPASPASIFTDFKTAVNAYFAPPVLSANPSQKSRKRLPVGDSLIHEDAVEVYLYPNHQFQMNYLSRVPFQIHPAYVIDYITMTIQPYFTFGGGNMPNKISIMLRAFIKDTQGSDDERRVIKNVMLNFVVSNESHIHIFYDTTIPIHDPKKPYQDLKLLLIKLLLDARKFLVVHALHKENTPLSNALRIYINGLHLPENEQNPLIQDLFNADALHFPVKEDEMVIREFGQPEIRRKKYANYFTFYKNVPMEGGKRAVRKRPKA